MRISHHTHIQPGERETRNGGQNEFSQPISAHGGMTGNVHGCWIIRLRVCVRACFCLDMCTHTLNTPPPTHTARPCQTHTRDRTGVGGCDKSGMPQTLLIIFIRESNIPVRHFLIVTFN